MQQARRFPRLRFLALGVDWLALLYLSLCVYEVIDHWYPQFVRVRPSYHVPFPPWAWITVIVSTFLLALVWENLGLSLGFRALGARIVAANGLPAPLRHRAGRLAADLLATTATLLTLGAALAPLAGLGTWFHSLTQGAGLTFLPGVRLWPSGAWGPTFGYTMLAILILAAAAAVSWFLLYVTLRTFWLRPSGERGWVDGVGNTAIASAGDIELLRGRRIPWYRTASGLFVPLLIAFTFYVGWIVTEIDLAALFSRLGVTDYLWRGFARPDFTHLLVQEPVLADTIGGALIETIFMALMATIVGVLFAFPLSFLGARNLMDRGPVSFAVYTFMRGFFNIARSIETVIWATIIAVVVGWGSPFAGVLALAAHTIAALGKLFSEQVESIDPGPLEAMTAAGARRWQVVLYGVIPQIIPSYLAFTLYRWDINVRMSTVIGLVGGGGIGRILFYYKNDGRWSELSAVVILMVAVVWLMDYTSARVRERIT
jgi:phosphonate transport system permease protein